MRSPATWTRACSAARARPRARRVCRSAGSWKGTRDVLARERPSYQPWWRRAGYRSLAHHRVVLAGLERARASRSGSGLLSRRAFTPARAAGTVAGAPTASCSRTGEDVWLFTGCVMDAWQRDVHAATKRVIEAAGAGVALASSAHGAAGCCGALAVHAGLSDIAARMATRGHGVDAGRRADPRRLGRMRRGDEGLRAPARHGRGSRVQRACVRRPRVAGDAPRSPAAGSPPGRGRTARSRCRTRATCATCSAATSTCAPFSQPYVAQLVELDDEGLCCGAGGAYAALHPDLAGDIRARKVGRHRAVRRDGRRVRQPGLHGPPRQCRPRRPPSR